MWAKTCVVLVVIACCLGAVLSEENEKNEKLRADMIKELRVNFPQRELKRKLHHLDEETEDRANLFFRAMDANHDKKIDENDVLMHPEQLSQHMPGISASKFVSFISESDKNGDGKLDRSEFIDALQNGLKGKNPQLLETDSNANRRGFILSVAPKTLAKAKGLKQEMVREISGKIDTTNDGCVLCQYIVERCEFNVKKSGILFAPSAGPAFIEEEQFPFTSSSSVIASTRENTRQQRLAEREKYNQIYRVVDVTLDDVCEEGMPNSFYGYCKAVYQMQPEVVDGLRYQYRPMDVCFRIGMCGKDSYITKGVHSRYAG